MPETELISKTQSGGRPLDDPDNEWAEEPWSDETATAAYLGRSMTVYEWAEPVEPGDKATRVRHGTIVAVEVLNEGMALKLTGEFPA